MTDDKAAKEKRDRINEQQRARRKINGDKIRERDRKYRQLNRDRINELQRKNYEKNKTNEDRMNRKRESSRKFENNQKIKAFEMIGGCACSICGCTELSKLTIDHIDNSGCVERKSGLRAIRAITTNKLSKEQLENLRVLCWNHNFARCREYLDLPYKQQTYGQRYATKLWKEAFKFFGPCSCGESDLKFLTISHIHNDGAKRRKEGEEVGIALLIKFRNRGWPKSLKEDFCLECANCNCSRKENHPTLYS